MSLDFYDGHDFLECYLKVKQDRPQGLTTKETNLMKPTIAEGRDSTPN